MATPNHRERGGTMVETAIAFGVILLLVFGVIDFSRWMVFRNDVSTASTNGARYAVATGDNGGGTPRFIACDDIRQAALVAVGNDDLGPGNITVEYDSGPGSPVFATCPMGGPGPDESTISDGTRVVVTVSQGFSFVTPIMRSFMGSATVDSAERRTIFR